jgi:two-component system, response regulator PdtaR
LASKNTSGSRSTLELFRQLRQSRITIFHPKDEKCTALVQQLQRIGCQTVALWPPTSELPDKTDLVIFMLNAEAGSRRKLPWLTPDSSIPLIGMIEYENPTILDTATTLGCHGILVSPTQAHGILSSLIMAIHHFHEVRVLQKRNQRLEQKLQAANEISTAQAILARARGISAIDAYKVMREQAMLKRVTVEEIARAIVHAEGALFS